VQVSGWGNVSLILTGQLGDVMKESARAALTYAATHASRLHIRRTGSVTRGARARTGGRDPEGRTVRRVTMATAVVSAMSGRAVRKDVAMTGEITLRGRVLPIGGLKEKVLGAHRAGITTIVLPKANEADIEDIPLEVRDVLEFLPVDTLDEVLAAALLPPLNRRLEKDGNGGGRGRSRRAGVGSRLAVRVKRGPAAMHCSRPSVLFAIR